MPIDETRVIQNQLQPPPSLPQAVGPSKPTLDSLPSELKLKILRHLPRRDLTSSIVRLNREWHDLALDPSLWRTIDAMIPPDDVTRVRRVLARFPEAERIDVEAMNHTWDLLLDQIVETNSKHVTDVVLRSREWVRGYFTSRSGRIDVFDRVRMCEKLQSLTLHGFFLDMFPGRLVSMTWLRELRLINCTYSKPGFVRGIVETFPQLELLDLRSMECLEQRRLCHEDVVCIADGLEQLRALFFHVESDAAASCKYVARKCRRLEALDVYGAGEIEDIVVYVLSTMPTLKFLAVHSVKKVNVARCLAAASKFGSLKAVKFDCVGMLDNESVGRLSFACPSLEWFSADFHVLGDKGVSAVIEACPNLKMLNLVVGHSARVTGRPWLLNVAENLPRLRVLRFNSLRWSHAGLLARAAVLQSKVVMIGGAGRAGDRVMPPNDSLCPNLGVRSAWSNEIDNLMTLAALNGSGIPFAEKWAEFVMGLGIGAL